ncbi:MAG: hypothetical protein HFI90_01000 [Clostridia bacterium]|nr:hypothetical protein [Clostridia bacterium]
MKKKCFSLLLVVSMVLTALPVAFAAGPYTPATDTAAPETTYIEEELTNEYYALPNHENLLNGIMHPTDDLEYIVSSTADTREKCTKNYLSDTFPYIKLGISGSMTSAAMMNKLGLEKLFSYPSNPEEVTSKQLQLNYSLTNNQPIYFAFDLAHADEKKQVGSGTPKYFNRVSIAGSSGNHNPTTKNRWNYIDEWKLNITDDADKFVGTTSERPGAETANTVENWKTIYQNNTGENIWDKAGTVKINSIMKSRYLMLEVDNVTCEANGATSSLAQSNFRFTGFQVYLEDVVAKDSGYTLNAREKTVVLEDNPAVSAFLNNLELQDANLQAGVFTDTAASTEKTGNVANGNYLITYFENDGAKEIVSVYAITAPQTQEPEETPTATPTSTPTATPTPTPTQPPATSNDHAFTPDSEGMPATNYVSEELTDSYYTIPTYHDLLHHIIQPSDNAKYMNPSESSPAALINYPYIKVGGGRAELFNNKISSGSDLTAIFQNLPGKKLQLNFPTGMAPIYFAFDLAHEEVKAGQEGQPKYFNRVSVAGHKDNATNGSKQPYISDWKLNISNTESAFVEATTADAASAAITNPAWKTIYAATADETICGEAATVKTDSIIQSRYLMVEMGKFNFKVGSTPTNLRLTGFQVYLEDIVSNDGNYVVDAKSKLLKLTDGSNLPTVTDFLGKFTLQDAKLHMGVFSDAAGQTEKQASAQIEPGQDCLITYFGEGASKEIVSVYDINFPVPRVENVVINAAAGTDVGDEVSLTYQFQDCDTAAGHTDQSVIQWYADGALIDGATGTKYTLRTEDIGKNITAEVIPNCGAFQGKTVASAAPSATIKRIVVGNLMPGASVTEVENCEAEAISSMLKGFAADTGTVNAAANTIRLRAKLGDSRWVTSFHLATTVSDKMTGYEIVGYLNGAAVPVDSSAASGGGTVSKQLATPCCIDEIEVKVQSAGDGVQKLGVERFEIFSNLTDALAVSLDKQNLTIPDANAVVSDLTLPAVGAAYTAIRWTSSDESIITGDGKVKVPFSRQPHDVTMTAVITRGSESATVQIPLKVYGLDQFQMPPKDGVGENLTLFSVVTGEGELKPGSTAAMAADGKGTTGWIAKVTEDTKPSLTVDFGMEREINRLRAAETMNGIHYAIAGYTVTTSNDGITWNPLLSGTEIGEIFDKSFDVVECRYVKFTITALKENAVYGGIRELELYFEPAASDIIKMEEEAVTLHLPYMIAADKVELPQPKYGATFHWITENNLIADDGTVTHPKEDTKVTLSLQISRDGVSVTKSFGQFLITGTDKKTVGSLAGSSGGGRGSSSGSAGGLGILGNAPQVAAPQQPNETAAGFDDVPKTHWASGYIADLSIKGILSGVSQNRFAPEEAVTREQMAKLLVCAFEVPVASGTNPFTDVPSGDWSADYIRRAAESGLLRGIEDGIFGLGSNMSRQDVAVAIVRVLEQSGLVLQEGNMDAFTDADEIDEYAKAAVAKLYKAGVMVGDDLGSFRPAAEVTRAEAAKIVYVAIRLASGSGE